MGGELGNLYRCSSCVFSIVSTKFHLDREHRLLCEFSVQKLMLLRFRGYLGDIESAKQKSLEFFMYFFFRIYLQCCVRVSPSNLEVLTR